MTLSCLVFVPFLEFVGLCFVSAKIGEFSAILKLFFQLSAFALIHVRRFCASVATQSPCSCETAPALSSLELKE